jgi:hypothetical protein
VQVSPGTSAYVPDSALDVIVAVSVWRQSGKHADVPSGLVHDTVAVRLLPLAVPVMNCVDDLWPGNTASHVPPAIDPAVPSVTVSVPEPFTESVIVPVYTVCGAVGVGSVGSDGPVTSVVVGPSEQAAIAAATPAIRSLRLMRHLHWPRINLKD